jgi:hypothetical protein
MAHLVIIQLISADLSLQIGDQHGGAGAAILGRAMVARA